MLSEEIQAHEVIRLIETYLLENGYYNTLAVLQEETSIFLNAVSQKENYKTSISDGLWQDLLLRIAGVPLTEEDQATVVEQIILDLVHKGDVSTAKKILRMSPGMLFLKLSDPQRAKRLEFLCSQNGEDRSANEHHRRSGDRRQREKVVSILTRDVDEIPSERLREIVSNGIRSLQLRGVCKDESVDLFTPFDLTESVLRNPAGNISTQIEMDATSRPESLQYSKDGSKIVVGCIDGSIETWDSSTLLPSDDVAEDGICVTSPVTSLSLSMIRFATIGTFEGSLSIWDVDEKVCRKSFDNLHSAAITYIAITPDLRSILTAGYDGKICLVDLKGSKRKLVFQSPTRAPQLLVALLPSTEASIFSFDSEGCYHRWLVRDPSTPEVSKPLKTKSQPDGFVITNVTPFNIPGSSMPRFLVCTKTTLLVVTSEGDVVTVLEDQEDRKAAFVCATAAPGGSLLYGALDSGVILCFGSGGKIISRNLALKGEEIVVLRHSPNQNNLVAVTDNGSIVLFK